MSEVQLKNCQLYKNPSNYSKKYLIELSTSHFCTIWGLESYYKILINKMPKGETIFDVSGLTTWPFNALLSH